ncbi:MAG: stage V sporulation protein AE [Ruminococcaceae bacterium]|nr:stage V sporulation protein AE [Oscillospiraceae bacterium]
MHYIWTFLIGGLLCVIAQILIDKCKLTPARILVIYVSAGTFLTLFGWYEPLVQLAGAGATIPLTGFGYTLAKGVAKGVAEKGLLGILTGGITGAAAGITAAIVFGYLMALIFRPKAKK